MKLPPLRERIEDLPELAAFFLRRYCTKFRKQVEGISESALRMLSAYWWPGNIRELENLIERLVAITDKTWITEDDLPFEFRMAQLDRDPRTGESLFQDAMTAFERNLLIRALEKNGWNVTATARYLGSAAEHAEVQAGEAGRARIRQEITRRVSIRGVARGCLLGRPRACSPSPKKRRARRRPDQDVGGPVSLAAATCAGGRRPSALSESAP